MNWIDLHCDTPLALYRAKCALRSNSLHIDLAATCGFERFLQCAALFCPPGIPDAEGFSYILEMLSYFTAEIGKNQDAALLVRNRAELERIRSEHLRGFLLTVEDARILDGQLSRIEELRTLGVRIITPFWRGTSPLGGAHDTAVGLTAYGRDAILQMLALGILPDVSHASAPAFFDIAALCRRAGKPLIATHSAADALFHHARNLSDAQIREIGACGGVIGVNLYPVFLTGGEADIGDLLRHIRYIMQVGGAECVALGTDLDGVDVLPRGISSLADMAQLPDYMRQYGFSATEIECVLYRNAERIIELIFQTEGR